MSDEGPEMEVSLGDPVAKEPSCETEKEAERRAWQIQGKQRHGSWAERGEKRYERDFAWRAFIGVQGTVMLSDVGKKRYWSTSGGGNKVAVVPRVSGASKGV